MNRTKSERIVYRSPKKQVTKQCYLDRGYITNVFILQLNLFASKKYLKTKRRKVFHLLSFYLHRLLFFLFILCLFSLLGGVFIVYLELNHSYRLKFNKLNIVNLHLFYHMSYVMHPTLQVYTYSQFNAKYDIRMKDFSISQTS